MGYFANLFAKANEIDRLTSELALLRGERDRAIWERERLNDEVRSERSKRDRDASKYLRILTTKNGANGNLFIEKEEKSKSDEPKPFTDEQEIFIMSIAQDFVDDEIAKGYEPKPIEVYAQSIRDHPDDYLPLMK